VSVDNPSGKLLPGMTANVKLVYAEKPNVLRVPNAALRFRPPGTDAGPGGGAGAAGSGPRAGGGAPAAGGEGSAARRSDGGGGSGRLEAMRERLVSTYKLSEEQQRKLDAILQDVRAQFAESQGLPEAERQARMQKNREATRLKIREILTPEQRARYDADSGTASSGRGGGTGSGTPGRVFVQGPDGKPQAVPVVLGISDGASTEVISGELKEGQEVLVGTVGGPAGGRPGAAPAGGSGGGPGGPRLRL
jgi:HlyD family secretion protein